MQISNWTLLRNYLLTEHENRLWLQLNSLFSCTSLDAWMITSTAARIELLVCKANARSFTCAHCVQSADLQVCCPTCFTSLLNDLSPEGPAATGVAHKIIICCPSSWGGRGVGGLWTRLLWRVEMELKKVLHLLLIPGWTMCTWPVSIMKATVIMQSMMYHDIRSAISRISPATSHR